MAMMTKTEVTAGLKTLYTTQKMNEVLYGDEARPFFNMLEKPKDFAGNTKPCPVYYEDPAGGGSATYEAALANCNAPQLASFAIDVVENFQIVQISTDALLRARNDRGSFLTTQQLRIDGAMNAIANNIELSLFGSSTGSIGRLASTTTLASTSIDLAAKDDAKKFFVGQRIVFADSLTGALKDNGKSLQVTAVDPTLTTDQVTVSANLNTVAGIANTDYIFREGDAQNGGSTALKISGLGDWIPATAPTAGDTHFGSTARPNDPNRLAGYRFTGALADIPKALTDALAAHHNYMPSASVGIFFINSLTWGRLVDQLGRDVQREPGKNGVAGFQYVTVMGPKGPVKCVPATYEEENVVHGLDMKTWYLDSMLEPIRINQDDGLMVRKIPNASGLQVDIDSHCQLACRKPGFNFRVALS